MGLETGTYIDDLVVTNPLGTDGKSQGDDHIRLLKSTVKNTFPNANRAFNLTQAAEHKDETITVTVDATLTNADLGKMVLVDASLGQVKLDLPDPATPTEAPEGWVVAVRRIDNSGNTVTVASLGSATFDGSVTFPLISQYYTIVFRSDGANWQLLGMYSPTVAYTDQQNTFTVAQTIEGALTVKNDLLLDKAAAVVESRMRNELTSGFPHEMYFTAHNDAGDDVDYANVSVGIETNTAGAEDGSIDFNTIRGGTLTRAFRVLKGLVVPDGNTNPADGDKGPGTINLLNAIYRNGEQLRGGQIIDESSVSAAATYSIAWNNADEWKKIEIFISKLLAATNGVTLHLRTSSDGGTTYDSGASDYRWRRVTMAGTYAGANSLGDDKVDLTAGSTNGIGNVTGEEAHGKIELINPVNTAAHVGIHSELNGVAAGGNILTWDSKGERIATAGVEGIQLFMSSGDIATAEIVVMGWR